MAIGAGLGAGRLALLWEGRPTGEEGGGQSSAECRCFGGRRRGSKKCEWGRALAWPEEACRRAGWCAACWVAGREGPSWAQRRRAWPWAPLQGDGGRILRAAHQDLCGSSCVPGPCSRAVGRQLRTMHTPPPPPRHALEVRALGPRSDRGNVRPQRSKVPG